MKLCENLQPCKGYTRQRKLGDWTRRRLRPRIFTYLLCNVFHSLRQSRDGKKNEKIRGRSLLSRLVAGLCRCRMSSSVRLIYIALEIFLHCFKINLTVTADMVLFKFPWSVCFIRSCIEVVVMILLKIRIICCRYSCEWLCAICV